MLEIQITSTAMPRNSTSMMRSTHVRRRAGSARPFGRPAREPGGSRVRSLALMSGDYASAPLRSSLAGPARSHCNQRPGQRRKEGRAVIAALRGIHDALGMRHQAENAAIFRQNARDIGRRPVRVADIGEGDPVLALQPGETLDIDLVVAIMMGDGKDHLLPRLVATGEDAVGGGHAQPRHTADELAPRVAHQRAGQKARLAQNLETVADTQNMA